MSTMHRRIPRNNQRRTDWRSFAGMAFVALVVLLPAACVWIAQELVR